MRRAIDHYKVSLLHLMKSFFAHSAHAKYLEKHQHTNTLTHLEVGSLIKSIRVERMRFRQMDGFSRACFTLHWCLFTTEHLLFFRTTGPRVTWLFSMLKLSNFRKNVLYEHFNYKCYKCWGSYPGAANRSGGNLNVLLDIFVHTCTDCLLSSIMLSDIYWTAGSEETMQSD